MNFFVLAIRIYTIILSIYATFSVAIILIGFASIIFVPILYQIAEFTRAVDVCLLLDDLRFSGD